MAPIDFLLVYAFAVIVGREGAIYRAVDNLTKEEVAVKVYNSSDNKLKNVKVEINE